MKYLTKILVVFLLIVFVTVNTYFIENNVEIEQLIEHRINANKQLSATVAAFRHRFEHSPNFQEFKWAIREKLAPPYCQFCDIFVPTVSFIEDRVLQPFALFFSLI